MKSLTLVPFLAAILVLAVACGSDSPTPAVGPQSTAEIEKAAVELFDEWREANKKHDASTILSLLPRNVAESCTVEEMEQFFEISDQAFTYPDMAVKDVFVARGNTEEAIMSMELLGEPQPGEQGLRDAYVASIPYPIVKQDGRWRMVLQFPIVGDDCPFVYSSSSATPLPSEDSTPRP